MNKIAPTPSSFNYQWTYDVFINFHGEDTRYGFTGNLYKDLKKAGVRTFFDDEEIKRGDEITPTLIKAIENSRMAITVFSTNYASSTFCLNELVKIHECIKMKGRLVLPIFYDVDPSHVRHQKENYEQELSMHIKNLRADEDMIQSWKLALNGVANIAGHHFISGQKKYEYQFNDDIVKEIFKELIRVPLHVATYPIGLKPRILAINSLLQVESNDKTIMVGICGIGGIGKTTIARAVYNFVADKFEGICFYHDIKDHSEKVGLAPIQETILSEIVGVDFKNKGVLKIKDRFQQKKILLVLDNVDKLEQLRILAGDCEWFGAGSRIIITTRNRHLLKTHGVQSIYNMEALNPEESRELLSYNAFKNPQIDSSYKDVLNCAATYAQGLPLALEVIGSNLCGKPMNEWESALDTYKLIPNRDIQKVLKVSYEGLEQVEKEIFLDIACFFNGERLEYVKYMVELVHGFNNLSYFIGVLKDKCLIKINFGGRIEMHNLIRDMGREIVREESPSNPGERSRLWFKEDIVNVLQDKTGKGKVTMIIQDNSSECIEVKWDGKAFKDMTGLKMLNFKNMKFSKSPKYLPNSLRVLKWKGFPCSSFPPKFHPKKLVVLDIENSNLSSLKKIKRSSNNLGILNLSYCQNVTKIPDLSNLPNLKELNLSYCENLAKIHDSVSNLANLEILDVSQCGQLKIFPSAIRLPSLRELNLSGCSSLKYFPEILQEAKVTYLSLYHTGIEKLPGSICNLTQLYSLEIEEGKSVMEIPNSIFLFPKLFYITVKGMVKISFNSMEAQQQQAIRFKECGRLCVEFRRCNLSDDDIVTTYLTRLITVVRLDLTGNNFTILPSCIKQCLSLGNLVLNECKHLRDVQGIPPKIYFLEAINCTSLSSESKSLIWSEGLYKGQYRYTCCVPSRSMPEWFEHRSKGASISFWYHKSLTSVLCLCFLFKPQDGVLYSNDCFPPHFTLRVSINGGLVDEDDELIFFDDELKQFDDHHLVVYNYLISKDLICDDDDNDDDDDEHECNPEEEEVVEEGDDDDEIDEHQWNSEDDRTSVDHIPNFEIKRHEWLHVQVEVINDSDSDSSVVIEECGMHVINQLCDMQHISFHNPYESLASSSSGPEQCDTWMMKEKEGPLYKKSRLMGGCNFASSSTMFGCTEGGRNRSSINGDNNANEIINHKGASLIGLDLNIALPVLPWTEDACGTFTNQDLQRQENVTTLVNVEQVPVQSCENNNKKCKGKEIVIQ